MSAPGGIRVGLGYDSHRFDPDRTMVLGGVVFPDTPGLKGHSDGDAVAHALIDAILGAATLGNVGSLFPPNDEQWAGADSMALLETAMGVFSRAGWVVGNVDITVICEAPKIGPRVDELRTSIANGLAVGPDAVSIKGKTNETMGWIGRGEGLAVHVVALIHPASGSN